MNEIRQIKGEVFFGLGKGAFFVGLEGYRSQIREKLGFVPFPGTLNLKVDPREGEEFLASICSIKIGGFEKDGKKYGDLDCKKAKIRDIVVFVIRPAKTHYDNSVFEIIASESLRERFELKDGDSVSIASS